jgi:excisionase family DNA binding protein
MDRKPSSEHRPRQKEVLLLLRPAEVAEILGLHRNTIYRWLRRGILGRIRLDGSTYINGQELLDRLAPARGRPAFDPELRSRARALLQEWRLRETRSSDPRSV